MLRRGSSASGPLHLFSFSAAAMAAGLAGTPHVARADDKRVCLTSFVDAQRDRKAAHLRRAAIDLTRCGSAGCPAAVRDDCVRWFAEVQADTPSLVISFTDAAGTERSDVSVSIDGETRGASLDGRALPVDPGAHRVAVTTARGEVFSTTVLVREGEHDRPVTVRAPPLSRVPVIESRPVPPLAWVLGGVGAAGVLTWAGFGLAALYAHPGLESTLGACKPSCPAGDVTTVRTRFAVADIAGGLGALSLAGAAYVFFTRPVVSAPATFQPDVSFGPDGVRGGFRVTF